MPSTTILYTPSPFIHSPGKFCRKISFEPTQAVFWPLSHQKEQNCPN